MLFGLVNTLYLFMVPLELGCFTPLACLTRQDNIILGVVESSWLHFIHASVTYSLSTLKIIMASAALKFVILDSSSKNKEDDKGLRQKSSLVIFVVLTV